RPGARSPAAGKVPRVRGADGTPQARARHARPSGKSSESPTAAEAAVGSGSPPSVWYNSAQGSCAKFMRSKYLRLVARVVAAALLRGAVAVPLRSPDDVRTSRRDATLMKQKV